MNTEQKKLLLEIGLTENDILVYQSLIPQGSRSINQVVEETQLPRSTVVLSLEKLINDKIITYHSRGKRKNYVVDTPQRLVRFMDKKIAQLQQQKNQVAQDLIPMLEQDHFLSGTASQVKAKLLSGEEGFKTLYNLTLEQEKGGEILRFGGIPERFIIGRDFLKQYVVKRDSKKIRTRLILSGTEMAQSVKDASILGVHETKVLPKDMYAPTGNIAIWGDKVSFISWDKELSAIVIENENMAQMMRMIFETCWESGK